MYTQTIPTHFIRELLMGAELKNTAISPIMRKASIPPEFLNQDKIRFSAHQYSTLTKTIAEQMEDEFLGFLYTKAPPGTFAMMCYAIDGCNSLKHLIDRCIKFLALFTNKIEWNLSANRHEATFSVWQRGEFEPHFILIHYLSLFYMHRLSSWYIGKQIPLNNATFAYRDPGYSRAYRYLFPCSHKFYQQSSSITFNSKFLSNILIRSEEDVNKFLIKGLTNLLVLRVEDESVSYKIRMTLSKMYKKEIPSFETVAEKLNMSTATLSRSLLKEKTTYQFIKDEFRRDIAINQFRKARISIENVAEITGFSEASSFQRAFKRWTGITPGTYKNALNSVQADSM